MTDTPATSTPTRYDPVERRHAVTEQDLYDLPEGTVLYKPEMSGWTLLIRDQGWWRVVDAFDPRSRGTRMSPAAVGCYSPGYVVHQPPAVGYYEPEARDAD